MHCSRLSPAQRPSASCRRSGQPCSHRPGFRPRSMTGCETIPARRWRAFPERSWRPCDPRCEVGGLHEPVRLAARLAVHPRRRGASPGCPAGWKRWRFETRCRGVPSERRATVTAGLAPGAARVLAASRGSPARPERFRTGRPPRRSGLSPTTVTRRASKPGPTMRGSASRDTAPLRARSRPAKSRRRSASCPGTPRPRPRSGMRISRGRASRKRSTGSPPEFPPIWMPIFHDGRPWPPASPYIGESPAGRSSVQIRA